MTGKDEEEAVPLIPLTSSSSVTTTVASATTNRSGYTNGNNNDGAEQTLITTATTTVSQQKQQQQLKHFKLLLLVCMVFQNSATVLVARYTRSVPITSNDQQLYSINHLIMITEITKLLLSCIMEQYYTSTAAEQSANYQNLYESVQYHIVQNVYDTIIVSIPALLYLVQTSVLYIALENLTAPIFQVTYQMKLVTTALLSVVLLQRTYTFRQWICLVVLSIGVAIVVLGEQQHNQQKKGTQDDNSSRSENLWLGLLAVGIASFSSALAGVYFEKVLKRGATPSTNNTNNTETNNEDKQQHHQQQAQTQKQEPSLWMRNIQLSCFSILIAYCQNLYKQQQQQSSQQEEEASIVSYLHGFTIWVWILVLLQAGGGLLVAAIIKYADNVLKGLATGVSIVTATLVSQWIFPTPTGATSILSHPQFLFGSCMILLSVYYFNNPFPTSILNNILTNKNRSS